MISANAADEFLVSLCTRSMSTSTISSFWFLRFTPSIMFPRFARLANAAASLSDAFSDNE